MKVEIGGLRFSLRGGDDASAALCASRYAAYELPEADVSAPDLDVTLRAAPPADFSDLAGIHEPSVEGHGDVFSIRRADLRGALDLAAKTASFSYAGDVGAVQSFLRIALSLLLARTGGISIHASSVVRAGCGFVFPGASGAGKTTIARLSRPARVLSDEVSAVRLSGRAATCHATPFWGDLERDPGGAIEGRASGEVRGVLFPVHADGAKVEIRRMSRAEALAALLHSVFYFGQDAALVTRVFETCAALVETTWCAQLLFRPDTPIWEHIDGSLAAAL